MDETVRVELEPWPPYSAKDIHEKANEIAEELNLKNCFEYWSCGLVMNLPMNETAWKFCKKMRMYCGVNIFSSE